ncbi:hypothetical protein HDU97_004495 [Phlyctochytrium planicorne]|nr:hypothetical protein HDU97_004495 [Phlyctochytrium planicorne]
MKCSTPYQITTPKLPLWDSAHAAKLSIGVIAGIVVAITAVAGSVIVLAVWYKRRQSQKSIEAAADDRPNPSLRIP